MTTTLHQRATAQTRRKIAAWRERRANPPKPERTPMGEHIAGAFTIGVTLLLLGWPIYGLFGG